MKKASTKYPLSLDEISRNSSAGSADKWDLRLYVAGREVYPQVSQVQHVHHAGNSSGVVDGAAAMLVASSDWAQAHGMRGRARIRMTAVAGAEPVIMLTAPGPASLRCLEKAPADRFADIAELDRALAQCAMVCQWDADQAEAWWLTRDAMSDTVREAAQDAVAVEAR